MPNRRAFLASAGALAAGLAASPLTRPARSVEAALPAPPIPQGGRIVEHELVAAERSFVLPALAGRALPLWTFSAASPLPVLRLRLGDRLRVRLTNALPRKGEHVSIHWHGIRVPIGEDGVPYISQAPVEPGQSFTYDFVPPDTGTFFFHTHCNTAEQLGRGLSGILIVEGDETVAFDAERILVMRDWRIDPQRGTFLPFFTDQGASGSGSFGPLRTVNGEISPTLAVPPNANIRVRLLNIDATRIAEIGLRSGSAMIIAIDGIAVEPFRLSDWWLGPAMRLDLALRSGAPGSTIELVDNFAEVPQVLARFAASGAAVNSPVPTWPVLRSGRAPMPDLEKAERLSFELAATAAGARLIAQGGDEFSRIIMDSLCLSQQSFWAMNKRSWPGGDRARLPPPLMVLRQGQSYVVELRNLSQVRHPIHLHGHSFRVLSSNKRRLPVHWADTVLVAPRERVEIAFRADNPGDWMFHCHLIEHQEAGMMGYLQIQ
jgi:FtsP/CotA-like multicopper oxidase with cupredoxin domain